jgi:hypothetical protein
MERLINMAAIKNKNSKNGKLRNETACALDFKIVLPLVSLIVRKSECSSFE